MAQIQVITTIVDATLVNPNMSSFSNGNYTLTVPSKTDTLATLSDIPSGGGGNGSCHDDDLQPTSLTSAALGSLSFDTNKRNKVIDLTNYDLSSTTSLAAKFNGFNYLREIRFHHELTFDSVTNCSNMFYNCYSLEYISLPKATFSKITTANSMFYYCYSLRVVNLPEATFYNTVSSGSGYLTSISSMFRGCSSLTNLCLPCAIFSNYQSSRNFSADNVFYDCISLQSICLPEATFVGINSASNFFYNCASLTTITMLGAGISKLMSKNAITGTISNLDDTKIYKLIGAVNSNGRFVITSFEQLN